MGQIKASTGPPSPSVKVSGLNLDVALAGGPGWAGSRQLVTAAAGILQALLEPSEYESEAIKQARRTACLTCGVVKSLLGQLFGANEKLKLYIAASLRFIALAPGAAEVLAGESTWQGPPWSP